MTPKRTETSQRIEIRVGGGGPATADLYRWLRRDPRVRRHAQVTLGRSRPDAAVMGAYDVVELVVGQGIAALNLALSYAAWRATRPAAPSVTLTANGRSITVRGRCDEATTRLIAELLQDGGGDPAAARDDRESA
ncbi:effector-associated constant component EACC1 [Streptomyces flavalbus]|uniref:Uncharacterized protein n=1 Tax=Streptomyces flavalbus TaxID=2665155 RepID=A0ABW2W8I7_9ACTN